MNTGVVLVFVISTNMCYFAVSLWDAALYKPCKQSESIPNWDASNAVDGIIDYSHSCTHTLREDNPWWEVDLQGTYSVHSVLLRNRAILGQRLSNFTIWVRRDGARQGTKCTYHNGAIAVKSYKVLPCDYLMSGRFVKITKETKHLTLCEVQVLVIERSGLLFKQTNKIIKGEPEREMACSRPLTCAVYCQRTPSCLAFQLRLHTHIGTNDEWSFYVTLAKKVECGWLLSFSPHRGSSVIPELASVLLRQDSRFPADALAAKNCNLRNLPSLQPMKTPFGYP